MLILATLLVFFFAALYYITTTYIRSTGEATISRQQLSETELVPLRTHIQDCLDLASRNGLALAGFQGGLIYRSQQGPHPDPNQADLGYTYLTYDGKNLPYAIIPPQETLGPYQSDPPEYPWDGFPEYQAPCTETCPGRINLTKAFAGYNLLTKLGKNFSISMQDQLEDYILTKTTTCIDWQQFTNKNLEFSKGTPMLNVSIAQASTIITLDYPIEATNTITGAHATLRAFAIEYTVRLGQMISFTSDIIDADISDLAFNLSASAAESLTFERKNRIRGLDYVIITTDPHSTILETPYELRFAIRNRRPALYLLNDSTHPEINTFIICGSKDADGNYDPPKLSIRESPTQFCIINGAGCDPTGICAPLNALDPDDNPPLYTYKLDNPESTAPTSGQTTVSEGTLAFLQLNNERLELTVNVTDGEHADSQTLRFPATLIART
ncbi:hypothetical protein HY641_04925 [Candidatus Woesearchaeota archaeon]|nr:hypothetical protein [Candidatus Woesearchaeota archaeon]